MLTLRQKRIAELLPRCKTLADVGCDHGFIGFYALKQGVTQNVIFTDISADSLKKAENLCREAGVNAKFICQDGIGALDVDCAVIAGMGGLEIIEILKKTVKLPESLVLQPMKHTSKVREYIQKFYRVCTDYLFYDKKYYNVMYLVRGCDCLTQQEIEFGRTNLTKPTDDFIRFLRAELDKCNTILSKCNDSEVLRRKNEITSLLKGELL